jgi:hypothetical protein
LRGGVDRVVVSKFCQRKVVEPIVLLEVTKDVKILFLHLIGDFSGTVGFRVEGSGQAYVHPEHFKQALLKLRGKLGTPV